MFIKTENQINPNQIILLSPSSPKQPLLLLLALSCAVYLHEFNSFQITSLGNPDSFTGYSQNIVSENKVSSFGRLTSMSQFPVVSRLSAMSGAVLSEALLVLHLEAFRFSFSFFFLKKTIARLKRLLYFVSST